MEYTIKKVAQLSGVSARTLRYYDEIHLLKPARINSSGYRIYGTKEIDRLQQILFYRSLDLKLEEIQEILDQPDFNISNALIHHHQQLLAKRNQLDQLILTVEKTLRYQQGESTMTDTEKFEGFKQEALDKNETQYGKEIRQKYGDETIEASNQKWKNMTEEDFSQMQQTEQALFQALKKLIESKDLDSEEARAVYEKHKQWLSYSWPSYKKEAHAGLADMYLADDRFASYYNGHLENQKAAEWLSQAIKKYAK